MDGQTMDGFVKGWRDVGWMDDGQVTGPMLGGIHGKIQMDGRMLDGKDRKRLRDGWMDVSGG